MSKANQELVSTGRDDQVTAFKMPDFQYAAMARLILYRLIHNRDIKIVITSRGTTTGTGKTTLAIILARWIHKVANDIFGRSGEWSAQDRAFVDVWEYLDKYKKASRGEVLITDELEYLADNRRSMTHENVYFSQAWSILRYKNVITIGTAPGMHQLDKRIPENADIWINVMTQGRANTYYLTVDDFTGEPVEKRFKMRGYRETILWWPLPESDPDFSYLHEEKQDLGVPGQNSDAPDVYEESDLEDARREVKRRVTIELLESVSQGKLDLTQAEIGDMVGYSQQNVAKIKREAL